MLATSDSRNSPEITMSHLPTDAFLDLMQDLARLHRPKLLLRTARHGTAEYHRGSDLRRILRTPATPAPGIATVRALIELEARHEDLRTRPPHEVGNPWRAARHVEVLIALIAEATLITEACAARTTAC